MDHQALEQLTSLIVAAHRTSVTDTPALVLPAGAKIESLESLQDRPRRKRNKFVTDRISDFARYCAPYAGKETLIFIAPDSPKARAVFDVGTDSSPSWQSHQASVVLTETRPYAALNRAISPGNTFSQRGLLDWLADWQPHIKFEGIDGAEISYNVAIQALQEIKEIAARHREHTEQDMKRARSTLEEITIKASKTTPTRLTFRGPPYAEFTEYDFDCRIAYRPGDDVTIRLVPIAIEAREEKILQEFREKLDHALHEVDYKDLLIGELST